MDLCLPTSTFANSSSHEDTPGVQLTQYVIARLYIVPEPPSSVLELSSRASVST